ncbi:MAG: M43 family zinc metalloprotease [Saprospiraceae bacterium]
MQIKSHLVIVGLTLCLFGHLKGQVDDISLINHFTKEQCATYGEWHPSKTTLPSHNKNLLNGENYVIPVVFHVFHENGFENIRREDLVAALSKLNERFNLKNADTIIIPLPFRSIMGNPQVSFRLATKAPDGNCTTGINRIQDALTYHADLSKVTSTIRWDRNKYLNIWVSRRVMNGNNAISGVAGFPGNAASRDGILIAAINLLQNESTLTHEVGHWLGLSHIWGNTNNVNPDNGCLIDDAIADTPIQEFPNTVCPSFPSVSCANEPYGDNFNNYMDYSPCRAMFTQGQVQRMSEVLNNSAFGYRLQLWQTDNLRETGTEVEQDGAECPIGPIANFTYDGYRDLRLPCNPVQFYDVSWKSIPTAWQWRFEGGYPTVSNKQHPLVSYDSSGTYEVKLIVSNAFGRDTVSRQVDIFVFKDKSYYGDQLKESFESSTIGKEIYQRSNANDGNKWINSTEAGVDDSRSAVRISTQNHRQDDNDLLTLPPMNLKGLMDAKLKFSMALALKNIGGEAAFTITMSNQCTYFGASQVIFSETDVNQLLTTAKMYPTLAFIPSPSDWKTYEIDIPAAFLTEEEVYVTFDLNASISVNNFYLDDIRVLFSSTSLDTIEQKDCISIFPNPFHNEVRLNLQPMPNNYEKQTYQIYDTMGKLIKHGSIKNGAETIDLSNQSNGIYFIKIDGNGRHCQVKRLIKL